MLLYDSKIKLKLLLLTLMISIAFGANSEELPLRLQVALISKIIAMEHNLAQKKEVTIYVLNAPKVFDILKDDVGFKIGNSILSRLDFGKVLPEVKYDVLYIGSYTQEASAVKYAEKTRTLSLYPIINGMQKIGSLGLGIKSGKPMFLLDLEQSESEGLHWNSKILKIAQLK